jgi:hypothetical protein
LSPHDNIILSQDDYNKKINNLGVRQINIDGENILYYFVYFDVPGLKQNPSIYIDEDIRDDDINYINIIKNGDNLKINLNLQLEIISNLNMRQNPDENIDERKKTMYDDNNKCEEIFDCFKIFELIKPALNKNPNLSDLGTRTFKDMSNRIYNDDYYVTIKNIRDVRGTKCMYNLGMLYLGFPITE